ncbi:MAG: hypothetical protein AB7L71_04705 [Vicinamibacterales bacterium]
MQTHVKVLGWLFIIFGVFYVLLAFGSSMIMGLLATIVGSQGGEDAAVAVPILGLVGAAGFFFWMLVGIPGIITGWGLLNYKPWARIVAIILSAIRLINVPVGTALGIYGLWVLFNKDTEALFRPEMRQ